MYSHLSFLNHSESKLGIQIPTFAGIENKSVAEETVDDRAPIQKHADIVDYLQSLPRGENVFIILFSINY